MVAKGSPRLNLLLSKAGQMKPSHKGCATKKCGGSPREKIRASWNLILEKSLVELLHEHNTPDYRGQNGWFSEAWNKMVKKFHERNKYVSFTKAQIQEKEKKLKREYRMLKEARKQSGAGWNEERCMIEAEQALWDNLITSNQKLKKFRNKSFPLFDALGELYDGHTTEGTYNLNSTQPAQHAILTQVESAEELRSTEVSFTGLEETVAYTMQEDGDASVHVIKDDDEDESGSRINRKETKRLKKMSGNAIAGYMERYIDMREKQFEAESAQWASEKGVTKVRDYSIKRCISVLKTMEVTTDEKATAFDVFKNPDNREIFLSASEDDPTAALVWLRKAVAKQTMME